MKGRRGRRGRRYMGVKGCEESIREEGEGRGKCTT